ncbi:MAG: 1,2-phenylacetyl-CoA epoxidase subunit PaaD [Bacteroidota bacterium]|nr:1,2-phenylacetyl-CoA epoxidase subunit PaaD [Bacteroidota bacterium]
MLETSDLEKNKIMGYLHEIPDPEIPVIDIVELGVIRGISVEGNKVEVTITPTYSGCPAMKQMEDDIESTLKKYGYAEIKINTIFNPPWTTDWITDHAKEKLRVYGIVPPEHSTIDKSWLTGKTKSLACPRCKSKNTVLVSQFGSTSCKALYKCLDCLEPFDYLKCI